MKKLSLLFVCVLALCSIGCEMKASSELTEDSEVGMSVDFERTIVFANNEEQTRLRMALKLRDNSDASTIKVGEGELTLLTNSDTDDLYDDYTATYPFAFLGGAEALYVKDFYEGSSPEDGRLMISFSLGERDYFANILLPEPIDFAKDTDLESVTVESAELKTRWENNEEVSYVEISNCGSLQNFTYMRCTETEQGFTLESGIASTPDININVYTQHPDSELSAASFVIATAEDLQPEFDFQGFDSVNVKFVEKAIREVVQQ